MSKSGVIVVTGAAGFIGSGIVRFLNDQGITDLVLVDELDHAEKVRNLATKQYLSLISIESFPSWLSSRASEVQAIIHLGACSDTLERDEDFLARNNTEYTKKLALLALKNQIRFIYASSAATYGDGVQGFSDDHKVLHSLTPLNLYGRSKHLFDLWALQEGILDSIVGLKYFNVFGPNEEHKGRMASMIYKMAPQIFAGKEVSLYKSSDPSRFADGGQCRDFIYVKDVAKMTCHFLSDPRGGIFNIGMGKPTTWNELSLSMFQAANQKPQIQYVDMPHDLVQQYQNYTCAEMGKFFAGYTTPLFTIKDAVYDYMIHHLASGKKW